MSLKSSWLTYYSHCLYRRWVLENKVLGIVRELAQRATREKLVLLDYFNLPNLFDPNKPLSHAVLLRQYIIDNQEALLRPAH